MQNLESLHPLVPQAEHGGGGPARPEPHPVIAIYRHVYGSQNGIQRPFVDTPLPFDDYYVALSMEQGSSHQPVLLPDLYSSPQVRIEGAAGMGKSTLCRFIMLLWSINVSWHDQFVLMIYLTLR